MNIDKFSADAVSRTYVQQAQNAHTANHAGKHAAKAASESSRADSVVLSDSARSLAAAREAVKSAADVREDKVNDIKQRVSDGTYSVSSRVLAQKLLDTSNKV
jgi:negative regulator of flagellin synthesis FlgM